ncbi:MAG: D-2-hydroxyacid dehydrogenase [Chitinophagales bacterium]
MIILLNICFLDSETLGTDLDLTAFNRFGESFIYKMTAPEQVGTRIQDQDIVIINDTVNLNENNLQAAARVKLICVAATGTDNVDLNYAKSRGITVCNVPGYSTQSVAQHTFALLFYLLESVSCYDYYVKSGQYERSNTVNHILKPFWELNKKTWGIIGMGKIGSTVAHIAEGFGCNIVYYSTSGQHTSPKYTRLELDSLLNQSDIVSIHAPLNAQTLGLIGYPQLKQMNPHAILLNLGRGGIIKEADLARALDEGLIAGAGLDVLEQEPILSPNPLLGIKQKDRLVITPHIAWTSIEARQNLIGEVVSNIEAYLQGTPRNVVN